MAFIFKIKAFQISSSNIFFSKGLYTLAKERKSFLHILHFQTILLGLEMKLHLLFKQIKFWVDKFKYRIFSHLIHFIISLIIIGLQ